MEDLFLSADFTVPVWDGSGTGPGPQGYYLKVNTGIRVRDGYSGVSAENRSQVL